MNIFATDYCPLESARFLCDQHVRSKMIVESAQMLQHCYTQEQLNNAPLTQKGTVRRSGKGYYNHPCSVWVRQSKANFHWLVDHSLAMIHERNYRWPSSAQHFTETFLRWCDANEPRNVSDQESLTPFAVAIKESCECRKLLVFDSLPITEQYRAYIRLDKPFATWTTRPKPFWY